MYKPGGRPIDLVKTETKAENVEPEAPAAAEETKTEATPDATTATQTNDTAADSS